MKYYIIYTWVEDFEPDVWYIRGEYTEEELIEECMELAMNTADAYNHIVYERLEEDRATMEADFEQTLESAYDKFYDTADYQYEEITKEEFEEYTI